MKANRIQKPRPKAARNSGSRQCSIIADSGDRVGAIECMGGTRLIVK